MTKHKLHPQSSEALLKGTGLLSKEQAFQSSGVSRATFVRALSVNFKGNRPLCGMARSPGLKAVHRQVGDRIIVAVDPKDLSAWKQQRKEKALRPTHKTNDQARVRGLNGSAR